MAALIALPSYLLGIRSALRQDEVFDAVMAAWSKMASGHADKPVQFDRFGQLTVYPGKTEMPRPEITGRTLVAFTFGQSNAANSGGERHAAETDRVVNYWSGRFWRAADPLLGASGKQGSVWVDLGNRLVGQGLADRVVLVAAGVGGSSVRDWRPGGRLHGMLLERLQEARRDGLSITHFLWHQGEADHPAVSPLSLDEYRQGLSEIIAVTKRYFPGSVFFVAQASLCHQNPPSEALKQVQAGISRLDGVYLGPDTDTISTLDRHDDCHLSGRGLDKHAAGWLRALARPAKEIALDVKSSR